MARLSGSLLPVLFIDIMKAVGFKLNNRAGNTHRLILNCEGIGLGAGELKRNNSGPKAGESQAGVNRIIAEDSPLTGPAVERQTRGDAGPWGARSVQPVPGIVIANEELCTAGSDHAVITWVTPGREADTSVYVGSKPSSMVRRTFRQQGEFHYAELTGLKPATRYWYQVESGGARGSLNSFSTLPRPRGRRLFSFALFSDLHLTQGDPCGDINEIFFGKLNEYSADLMIQCIFDAGKRNIDLAVLTGDLTDSASANQYRMLRDQILPRFGTTPYFLCPGNHDKFTKNGGLGEEGFLEYAAKGDKTYGHAVFKDCLFLLLDSCRRDDNWGYVDPGQIQWLRDILEDSRGMPSFLFLHHPCNGPDLWFGVKNYRELQQAIRPFPGVQGIFYGHMHRCKVATNNFLTGARPFVAVPATVQFPCAYAIVTVYVGGFEYNTYKVNRLDLSEKSREKIVFKNPGKTAYVWYSFGGLGDRCFSCFSGRLHRQRQFELSFTTDRAGSLELYNRTQPCAGASIALAGEGGLSRVVLGRHGSFFPAARAYSDILLQYGVRASILGDGGSDQPWL